MIPFDLNLVIKKVEIENFCSSYSIFESHKTKIDVGKFYSAYWTFWRMKYGHYFEEWEKVAKVCVLHWVKFLLFLNICQS